MWEVMIRLGGYMIVKERDRVITGLNELSKDGKVGLTRLQANINLAVLKYQ